ncbi:MAG: metallophosphoesterase, partial [Eubacterium sp.]|nr:metallophosphoesterase [Eubacterium sp.]
MTYFISDLHFGHRNILRFDCRPFSTIEEHDEYLISQWNDTVGIDDDVWILGDISWYSALKTVNILKRLNGQKHLCIGNHDHKLVKSADFQQQFVEIVDYKEISFGDGTGVVLCHYPIPCYNKHFYNWYHLYGHVHATFEWDMIEDFQNQMREQHQKKSQMYNV